MSITYFPLLNDATEWGKVTGDIANQVDLQTVLTGKSEANHNHNLNDLAEKNYSSLSNKPDFSIYALKTDLLGNGIKFIPITIANCENTITETTYWDVTIPANSFLDGEILKVESLILFQNGGATNVSLRIKFFCNEVEQYNQQFTVSGNTTSRNFRTGMFVRSGQNLYCNGIYQTQFNTGTTDNYIGSSGVIISNVNFQQDIRLRMTALWSIASPSIYFRNLMSKSFKY